MRKLLHVLLMVIMAGLGFAQTKIWEKSQAGSNYPAYLGTAHTERGFAYGQIDDKAVSVRLQKSQNTGNFPSYLGTAHTERGFAYGQVNGNKRIYMVSRKVGTAVIIIDAATGDSLGTLSTNGVTGGYFTLNDADVSDDGIIFASNMTLNASTAAFKVYKWTSESVDPVAVIEYSALGKRFGDKFTVSGSASDNSLTIWAAGASWNQIVKFTTADNGATFTPEVITLSDGNQGGSPAVFPRTGTTEFFVNSNGKGVARYQANGTVIDTIPTSVVGSGTNALRYFKIGDQEYLAVFDYITEKAVIANITTGLKTAVVEHSTPVLGSTGNSNGLGDVGFLNVNSTSVNIAAFGTNNGFGVYGFKPSALGLTERIYIVSRKGGTNVVVVDAATGDSVGVLSTAGVAGGTFTLNDAEISADGILFAANMTTDASASAFKVYKWSDEGSAPVNVISYTGLNKRLGDKFTVTGSASDNSLAIWAPAGTWNQVVKFTTADNGTTFTPEFITLSDGNQGASPAVFPRTGTTEFFMNSNGKPVTRYQADGTVIDTIPTSVVGTGSNALRYFEIGDQDYLAVFDFITERALIANITNGLKTAKVEGTTSTLGTVANGNGVGDIDYKANTATDVKIAVYATNNGFGLYQFQPVVSAPVFDPVAGSYTDSVRVSISTTTEGAVIYYTLDGSVPSNASAVYTGSILITDTTTVSAIAYKDGMLPSNVSSAKYDIVIILTAEAPVFDPLPGSYLDSVRVSMSTATPDAKIYYTTDLSDPTNQSLLYTEPVLLTASTTIKAAAFKDGMNSSSVVSGAFEIVNLPVADTLFKHWELTTQAESLPEYFSTSNYERGMAYGKVNDKDRVFVVTRLGAHRVVVHDALRGNVVGTLPKPAAAEGVGLFHINDVAVSEDGVIFVDNMTLGADAAQPFRVYRYDSESDSGKTVISYDGALGRMGDMFTVTGRADQNTLTIWAAVASSDKIVKFTTSDNGHTFTPEVITLQGAATNTQANVAPLPDGTFYLKSYARPLIHVAANGSVLDTVPTYIVGTSASRIRYKQLPVTGDVLLVYYPDVNGAGGSEYASVLSIKDGPAGTFVLDVTPSIGKTANGNGSGSVDLWKYTDDTFILFIMGTNNGLAAFSNTEIGPVTEELAGLVHTPGSLNVEIFNDGSIGFDRSSEGTGVTWKGQNGLWSGGPVFGSGTTGKANGLIPSWSEASPAFENDIKNVTSNFAAGFLTTSDFDQVTSALVNDQGASEPYGVEISQESYSKTGEEVVFLKYSYTNKTSAAIDNFYAGMFIDWDIDGNTYESNMGGIHGGLNLVYLYDKTSPYYYGVAAINGLDGANVTGYYPTDEADGRAKAFEFISKVDQVEFTVPDDYRSFQGTSLGTLNAGETKNVVFAIVAGDNLEGIKANTEAAFAKAKKLGWSDVVVSASKLQGIPPDFGLFQNYPNPFNPSTMIRYALPGESRVTVKVINMLGEVVTELLNGNQQAGYHEISWNASGLASGIYFYSIEASAADGSRDFKQVKKMLLIK